MAPGAELLTVIDNTVLNGTASQRYRDFILERFVIRQVVSLPFNTFFRAQANVQTSILHLKKRETNEIQGDIFMAILNNIGHDDHQQSTRDRDNTRMLEEAYLSWRETVIAPSLYEPNENLRENLGCPFQVFVVAAADLNARRIDAFYYAPALEAIWLAIASKVRAGAIRAARGSEFEIVPAINAIKEPKFKGKVFRYFEIGDVTPHGGIVMSREDRFEILPTRARLQVKQNDVLFARNNSSRGTSVIVPAEFDGHLVTTGFLAIRPT